MPRAPEAGKGYCQFCSEDKNNRLIFNEMSARRNEDGSKTLVRGELSLRVVSPSGFARLVLLMSLFIRSP